MVNVPKDPHQILAENWCEEFICAMKARMVQGTFRYGGLGMPTSDEMSIIQYVHFAHQRVYWYETTGDLEQLIDAANGLLIAWHRAGGCKRKVGQDAH